MTPRALSCILAAALLSTLGCQRTETADLLLVNARVYTLNWDDPDGEGRPAKNAPHGPDGWRPDAQAVAIKGDRIVFVGSNADAGKFRGHPTQVRDLQGATVLPGLIESHVHLENLGASLERVNLVGVKTEAEAVERVVARARTVPKGEWIIGWGWDEGAWASKYPDMRLLTERVPDHPVLLHGLHTFASWGNRLALERAGIGAASPNPTGGEIRKDARGQPTGIFLNSATRLVERAIPPATDPQVEGRIATAITALAAAGYVYVQEAGANTAVMKALDMMRGAAQPPLRVDAMLAARDPALLDEWVKRGPDTDDGDHLVVRSVKAFYDGAMGSRGAFFLEDYSDRPGHRGTGGADYGFDAERMAAMAKAGFQLVVHAIGDRANRETLDLFERLQLKDARPRIEHAQVVSATDIPRFASLGVIASMQPSHAVEDMPWAEARIGPRTDHRCLRMAIAAARGSAARLQLRPPGNRLQHLLRPALGHHAPGHATVSLRAAGASAERMTIEEAIRGGRRGRRVRRFRRIKAGVLAPGRRADLTVMDIDPFQLADTDPHRLLSGKIVATFVDGKAITPR